MLWTCWKIIFVHWFFVGQHNNTGQQKLAVCHWLNLQVSTSKHQTKWKIKQFYRTRLQLKLTQKQSVPSSGVISTFSLRTIAPGALCQRTAEWNITLVIISTSNKLLIIWKYYQIISPQVTENVQAADQWHYTSISVHRRFLTADQQHSPSSFATPHIFANDHRKLADQCVHSCVPVFKMFAVSKILVGDLDFQFQHTYTELQKSSAF